MRLTEIVGMMSTGALLTLGGMYVAGVLGEANTPAPAVATAPAPAAAPAPAPAPQVTRAGSALSSTAGYVGTVDRINQIVAASTQPLRRTQELSPMQREAIAFFERSARKQNESKKANVGSGLRFNNMAVDKLNVRYFYTVDVRFDALDRRKLIDQQANLVRANLCGSEAIVTLMRDYGFRYHYNYVSADGRFAGKVEADANSCA